MQKIIFKREIHDYFLEYANHNWYAKAVSGERRDLQIILDHQCADLSPI